MNEKKIKSNNISTATEGGVGFTQSKRISFHLTIHKVKTKIVSDVDKKTATHINLKLIKKFYFIKISSTYLFRVKKLRFEVLCPPVVGMGPFICLLYTSPSPRDRG